MKRNELTFKVKPPKYHRKKRVVPKEEQLDYDLVYITRVISRGDFDPNNMSHCIKANVARCHGVIDENNNILKEEYLRCKTKR